MWSCCQFLHLQHPLRPSVSFGYLTSPFVKIPVLLSVWRPVLLEGEGKESRLGCNVQKTSTHILALHWGSSEKRKQYIISISSYTDHWIYIVLELIPFMPQCPKHLTETAEEKKGFIWPQCQRITLCHNRRGVGRKTLSVRGDGEHVAES